MVTVNIELNEKDFDLLTDSSMRWSGGSWPEQDGRWEIIEGDDHIDWNLPMAYWVGENAANLILAREFLKDQGAKYQILWDMAQWENGRVLGFQINSDYTTATWKGKDV